jgi:hypothetical protein
MLDEDEVIVPCSYALLSVCDDGCDIHSTCKDRLSQGNVPTTITQCINLPACLPAQQDELLNEDELRHWISVLSHGDPCSAEELKEVMENLGADCFHPTRSFLFFYPTACLSAVSTLSTGFGGAHSFAVFGWCGVFAADRQLSRLRWRGPDRRGA